MSKCIWDIVSNLNNEYYSLQASGALDYYTLGNGDFSTGQMIATELKQQYYETVDSWKSLYRDKLWSDELNAGVQQYKRYKTPYFKDVNGNYYASGFMTNTPLPVALAPEASNESGWKSVLGPDENWETQSVVTGNRTGERALVPIESGHVSTPAIESWSEDGTDTGHSNIYGKSSNTDLTGNSSPSSSGSTGSGGSKTSSTRLTGYPRGGGGGYSRGGGGGGSAYTPNIYAPSINLSRPNAARIMNTDRIQDANLEYLRPDFETKGSREAYRRSDI